MREYVSTFVMGLCVAVIVAVAVISLSRPDPIYASEPQFGYMPFTSAYAVQSTADQTLLAAPGANYSWRVTSIWYEVTTAEANANVQLEDAAATPIVGASIPLDTKGQPNQIFFGDGVIFSLNSAVQVDFSGTTGECAFVINAVKERKQ